MINHFFLTFFHSRDRFTLKEIVNVEAKDDPEKGTRFLLELVRFCRKKKTSTKTDISFMIAFFTAKVLASLFFSGTCG